MKLINLRSNKPSFKNIDFKDGFNFIVAEKSEDSSDKDSTNGLGKSLLLEIVDYCLGGNPSETLLKEEMKDWVFFLEVEIDGVIFNFGRSVSEQSSVFVKGDLTKFDLDAGAERDVNIEIFKKVMGKLVFGYNENLVSEKKFRPSYRSLISYFMRDGSSAFVDPFAFFARQQAWSKQVNNALLLGLDWELSVKLSTLKIKLDKLETANKAIESGALNDLGGTLGELESEKINLETTLEQKIARLKNFKVYDDYSEAQDKADELTKTTHYLLNEMALNNQIIERYKKDLGSESEETLRVADIYANANIILSENVVKTLDEVRDFHQTVIKNRKDYLKTEIEQLKNASVKLEERIRVLTDEKAHYMEILNSHGALEEYSALQNDVNIQKANIKDIDSKIARLTEIEELISQLNVDIERMIANMRRDHNERKPTLAAAVKMFNANSEYLYAQPGKFSVDITKEGYKFKVDIKKSGSDGVSNMKVFCYDLMLAEFWSVIRKKPLPLFHDSKIFADVDPRQVALALELAKLKASTCGFQYICSMNSSYIPYDYLSKDFVSTMDEVTIVKYNDKDDTGTLLGVTF